MIFIDAGSRFGTDVELADMNGNGDGSAEIVARNQGEFGLSGADLFGANWRGMEVLLRINQLQ